MENGVHSVCFRGDFTIKTGSCSNSFENVSHIKAFYSYAMLLVADSSSYLYVDCVCTGVL